MRRSFLKMMVISFVTVLLLCGQALAQGLDPSSYGQNHTYQVLLRANGESIVNLSVDYVNTSANDISQVVFKAPNAKISDLKVWQYADYRKCYEQVSNREVEMAKCGFGTQVHNGIVAPAAFGGSVASSIRGYVQEDETKDKYFYQKSNTTTECYSRETNLLVENSLCQAQERDYRVLVYPDFWNLQKRYYLVTGSSAWQIVNATYTGDELKIFLTSPVPAKSKVTLSVRYRASGYVEKGLFGSRDFNFKTLATTDEIKSANVTVYADADLFFKGKKSNVGSDVIDQMMSAPKMGATSVSVGPELGLAYSGYYDGGYYRRSPGVSASFARSAQYLAAGETLTVTGRYATSWFGYNYKYILLAVVVIGLAIAAYILFKKRYRKWQEKNGTVSPQSGSFSLINFIRSNWVWGFMGAAVFMGGLIAIFMAYEKMPPTYRYSNGPWAIMYPISILISFLVSAGLFLGAPLYVGTKNANRTKGLVVFGYEIFFLFVANLIYFYFSNL